MKTVMWYWKAASDGLIRISRRKKVLDVNYEVAADDVTLRHPLRAPRVLIDAKGHRIPLQPK